MLCERVAGIIEAILFVNGEAVAIDSLCEALECPENDVLSALDCLEQQYAREDRGVTLKRFGGQVQLTSKGEYAPYIERLLQPVQKQSLSQAVLETLSIVAYRQPVTRQEVEAVRGVQCDYSLQALVQKNLLRSAGRRETLGRPILYATTDQFLALFGLKSLDDLPPLPVMDGAQEADQATDTDELAEE